MDMNTRAYFAYIFTSRWLAFNMDLIVIMVLTASCVSSVAYAQYNKSVGERSEIDWRKTMQATKRCGRSLCL